MLIFGITGSFGTGKTTVSEIFSKLGAEIIDADKIVHNIIKENKKVYKKIVSLAGKDILNKTSKQIDRKKLSKIVFYNKGLLKKLCEIIHPSVILEIKRQIALKKRCACEIIIIDAPLLIEANLSSLVDRLIVVKTKQKIQINRIVAKMKLSRSEILKRIKNQISLRDKIKLADYVIDNGSSFKNTEKQVKDIWNKKIRSNEVQTYGTA